jgi:hypothetical protein
MLVVENRNGTDQKKKKRNWEYLASLLGWTVMIKNKECLGCSWNLWMNV